MEILIFPLAYFIGSIPFGLIITKVAGLPDIRAIGSGNIGATNVLRTGKKHLAACTLVLDMIKGLLAVMLAQSYGDFAAAPAMCGLLAVMGHILPVWLGFKGGKGVATAIGVMLGLNILLGFSALGLWLGVAYFTRLSSISALAVMLQVPMMIQLIEPDINGLTLTALIAMSGIVAWRHKDNVMRVINGQEPKIGQK